MSSKQNSEQYVGLDIGGANLKVAYGLNEVRSIPFPLWKQPEQLAPTLQSLLANLPATSKLAVTMTGELADCFTNRHEGVIRIVNAVEQAAENRQIKIYHTNLPTPPNPLTKGRGEKQIEPDTPNTHWFNPSQAKTNWLSVAAANWHAIAQFSSRYLIEGRGFLIDIGSTTTDIIPIRNYQPASQGRTDFERLRSSELFYGGVQRTPLGSLCASFRMHGRSIQVAREFFATIEDAFLVTGVVTEDVTRTDTADGRPAAKLHAQQRLARMVCNDCAQSISNDLLPDYSPALLDQAAIQLLATQAIYALQRGVGASLRKVVAANPDLPKRFIITGQGDWFAKKVVVDLFGDQAEIILLAHHFGKHVSRSAAAYAVAVLAEESTASRADHWRQDLPQRVTRAKPAELRVIKLGGSLLAWGQTPERIQTWLSQQTPRRNVWIVGGGALAETVRDWSRRFPLDESTAHHCCLDLMNITQRLVNSWFPKWNAVTQLDPDCRNMDAHNVLLDFPGWLRQSNNSGTGLPESWSVSSDSCAAYFANATAATELVLLKSCALPDDRELKSWATAGIVDESFPNIAAAIATIRLVNLRGRDFPELRLTGQL